MGKREVSGYRYITPRYAGLHGFYWAGKCALVTYGAVFLQLNGFSVSVTGVVMALATVLSAVLLPVLALVADRNKARSLQFYLVLIWGVLLAVDFGLLLLRVRGALLLLGYLLLMILVHLPEPFMNAMADFCFRRGIPVNFGISRAIGSLSFAVSSFLIGYVISLWNVAFVPLFAGICVICCLGVLLGIPQMQMQDEAKAQPGRPAETGARAESAKEIGSKQDHVGQTSLMAFVKRYPRYTKLMTGYFFIAVFHVMTETYLLNMMQRIGGDSSSVGTALFIANVAEFVTIFFYERFRRLLSGSNWLVLTAALFAGKAVLFYLAPSVQVMYAVQTLQAVTYGFYAPSVVHFANEETAAEDCVQGQSIFLSVFTLGGSLGNLLGGLLLERFDARVMMLAGIGFALIGTLISLTTLERKKKTN